MKLTNSDTQKGGFVADETPMLWSTLGLNLLWLPWCDNWSNPSLHAITAARNPSTKQDVSYDWHWRVDTVFAARIVRAIHRAGHQGVSVTSDELSRFALVREYTEGYFPGCWPEVERLAKDPVELPEIPQSAYYFALIGLDGFPRWGQPSTSKARASGWYAWYEKYLRGHSEPEIRTPSKRPARQRQTRPQMF